MFFEMSAPVKFTVSVIKLVERPVFCSEDDTETQETESLRHLFVTEEQQPHKLNHSTSDVENNVQLPFEGRIITPFRHTVLSMPTFGGEKNLN